MNDVSGPTVARSPEQTLRTFFALRVINSLFVRAANDSIDQRYGSDFVSTNKFQDLLIDVRIGANVSDVRVPTFQDLGLATFLQDDSDGNFRGA